jgi:hypothetical protein
MNEDRLSPATRDALSRPLNARSWDGLAAVIAALVGLLALAVSGYTAYIQRQQVRAQVWPYLEPGVSGSKRELVVVNKGAGPALVRSVHMYVDGKPQHNWDAVYAALELKLGQRPPYSTLNSIVLSPGERLEQVLFQSPEDFNAFAKLANRVELSVCYCSTLNECWVYDAREKDPARLRREVNECPARSADDFIDNENAEAAPVAKGQEPAK